MKCHQALPSLLIAFSLSGCGGEEAEVHLGTRFRDVGWQLAYTLNLGGYGDDNYTAAAETWNPEADEDACCPGWGRDEFTQTSYFIRAGTAEREDGTPYEDGDELCRARFKWNFLPVDGFSMEERVLVEECVVEDGCFQRPCGPTATRLLLQSRNPGSDDTGTIVDFWVQEDSPAEDPPDPEAKCFGNSYPRSYCHPEDISEDVPPGNAFCPLIGPSGEPPPPHHCSLCTDGDPETCDPVSLP